MNTKELMRGFVLGFDFAAVLVLLYEAVRYVSRPGATSAEALLVAAACGIGIWMFARAWSNDRE